MSAGHHVPLSYRFALRKIATWQVQRQYLHFSRRPTPPPRFGADIEGSTPVLTFFDQPAEPPRRAFHDRPVAEDDGPGDHRIHSKFYVFWEAILFI